jgi:restriction system protein
MALGGSATLSEITDKVVDMLDLPESIQALPHGVGPQSELEYRLAWARTYLKNIDALENSARGVWTVTDAGRGLTPDACDERMRAWRANIAARRSTMERSVPSTHDPAVDGSPESDTNSEEAESWRGALLTALMQLTPAAFERLTSRLLREAGFININVTGRSGDEGIDGTGIYQLSLVTFPVFFQCKRYAGSVGPGEIRDFRGAMQGRGDRGLVLTTGTFTRAAKAEAARAGTQPLDLIDGQRLCDLMREFGLGLSVRRRVVEDIRIDREFFDEL